MENNKKFGIALTVVSLLLLASLIVIQYNYSQQASLLCEKLHEDPNYAAATCPVIQDKTPLLFNVGFVVSLAGILAGVFVYLRPKAVEIGYEAIIEKKPEKTSAEVDLNSLTEEEKQVYSILKEKGGSVFQGELVSGTGFSKVRVSRILDGLEQKGILERKRRGMANLVVLK